jgi:hypothetical protein
MGRSMTQAELLRRGPKGFARVLGGPIAWYKSLGYCTTSAFATLVKRGLWRCAPGAKLIEFARILDFTTRAPRTRRKNCRLMIVD